MISLLSAFPLVVTSPALTETERLCDVSVNARLLLVFLMCVSLADGADLPPLASQTNGVLHFSTVSRADGGNYTCVASSSAQGEIRAHVHLTVGGDTHTLI